MHGGLRGPHLELDDVGAEQAAQVGDLPQELHLRVLRLRHRAAHHLHRHRQHAAPHRLVHLPSEFQMSAKVLSGPYGVRGSQPSLPRHLSASNIS